MMKSESDSKPTETNDNDRTVQVPPPPSSSLSSSSSKKEENDEESLKRKREAMAITPDGEMPQKRFYRSRAHCNPLSHNDTFEYPQSPDDFDWTIDHYPNFHVSGGEGERGGGASTNSKNEDDTDGGGTTDKEEKDGVESKVVEEKEESSLSPPPLSSSFEVVPTILDIGCGFGGLTTALATILPDKLILGLEIRAKVTEYVRLRIAALRKENPGQYQNCSVLRSNTMKLMPHFFRKSSLDKIFFCFPDPHFKKKNHSRRIVAERLLTEYAYFLKDGGRLYTITDVEDLHNWHLKHCRAHPMFREFSDAELEDDPCVKAMYNETEEGKKVERAGTKKYYAVYEKIEFEKVSSTGSGNITAENFFEADQFGVFKKE